MLITVCKYELCKHVLHVYEVTPITGETWRCRHYVEKRRHCCISPVFGRFASNFEKTYFWALSTCHSTTIW